MSSDLYQFRRLYSFVSGRLDVYDKGGFVHVDRLPLID